MDAFADPIVPRRSNASLEDLDRLGILHPVTSCADHLNGEPRIVMRGQGASVVDQHGNELLDCGAGLWCMNIGYGREEVAEAAAQAMRELGYFHLFLSHSNEPIIRLTERLLNLLQSRPSTAHMARVFYGCSGSDANDTNVKLVRYYNNLLGRPRKKKILSRLGSYHGLTVASGSLTGIPAYHKQFDLPLHDVIHLSCPHYYRWGHAGESEEAFTARMVDELKQVIEREGADTIAAFIAEPVMGTGGVLMPPAGYFDAVQEVLAENDILLIVDEVITGIGRTGAWFASEIFGLKPDLLTLAKGITSAYFPLSASVISDRVWKVILEGSPETGPFMHGFTYSGHPVGGAVALKTLEIVQNESLVERSRDTGRYFIERLRDAVGEHPYIGDVRGAGLMIGAELVADRDARRPFVEGTYPHRIVARNALANGLLIRPLPFIEAIAFSPALTITRSEVDRAVDGFASALKQSHADLKELAQRS